MKNRLKNTLNSFAKWTPKKPLNQAQQQQIKGGANPWLDKP